MKTTCYKCDGYPYPCVVDVPAPGAECPACDGRGWTYDLREFGLAIMLEAAHVMGIETVDGIPGIGMREWIADGHTPAWTVDD